MTGLYPDWNERDPRRALDNTREAMDLAERWLGVPQLIQPDEMVNPNVDEQSMMTYLSQYPNARLKPGAPIRPKVDPNRVRCYGKGLYTVTFTRSILESYLKESKNFSEKPAVADRTFFVC